MNYNLHRKNRLNRRKKSKQTERRITFAARVSEAAWQALAFPILLMVILYFVFDLLSLSAFIMAISICLGIGYYLTGVINGLKFMQVLAFVWWAGAAVAAFWTEFAMEWQLGYFFCLLVVLLELIPAIVITTKWRNKENGKAV